MLRKLLCWIPLFLHRFDCQGLSIIIIDVAYASVHGRRATAAKAASSDKTAARIVMRVSGDRTPVNG
ncbi:hypothetical protein L1987_14754 [Smallanthus sonchifolius]|uniref:Uncharacterized protein n=1 Tax=Smallanthus sonchifolius TaxID=185202 RepID=A0ACB9J584_9ASTR|nr:hypothetical protein L1987_14754 [Smallanthus sonchifolius]